MVLRKDVSTIRTYDQSVAKASTVPFSSQMELALCVELVIHFAIQKTTAYQNGLKQRSGGRSPGEMQGTIEEEHSPPEEVIRGDEGATVTKTNDSARHREKTLTDTAGAHDTEKTLTNAADAQDNDTTLSHTTDGQGREKTFTNIDKATERQKKSTTDRRNSPCAGKARLQSVAGIT